MRDETEGQQDRRQQAASCHKRTGRDASVPQIGLEGAAGIIGQHLDRVAAPGETRRQRRHLALRSAEVERPDQEDDLHAVTRR
jgi:hypothetical protein